MPLSGCIYLISAIKLNGLVVLEIIPCITEVNWRVEGVKVKARELDCFMVLYWYCIYCSLPDLHYLDKQSVPGAGLVTGDCSCAAGAGVV